MAFHAGALRRLAEIRRLHQVVHASTVSGGSLFTGLLFHYSGYRWPSDDAYLGEVYPRVRDLLTSSSLQRNSLLRLALPCNWQYLTSRANVVAQSLERDWNIHVPLRFLPPYPVWSINGSCAESGRRFRFKSCEMGDYETGYAQAPEFPLASVMAMSAAFPGGIGPLTVVTSEYKWTKKATWGAKVADPHTPQFPKLHLYDGGVYDNLGVEPLFDMGKQELRSPEDREQRAPEIDYLLVSDAGLGYVRKSLPHPLNPKRLKRVADVAFDQVRSLRIRALMNFFNLNPSAGALLPIGFGPGQDAPPLATGAYLTPAEFKLAATVETNLKRMSTDQFDLVARHGYETAFWAAKSLTPAPANPAST